MSETRFGPATRLRGTLVPPPDKSISHRAAIVAAMGDGETVVRGYLGAADTRATLEAVRALGASVNEGEAEGGTGAKLVPEAKKAPAPRSSDAIDVRIIGVGLRGAAPAAIDVATPATVRQPAASPSMPSAGP